MTRHAIDYREHVMHRVVPSAKQMEDSRKTHYFRDENDDRLVVITQLLPNGDCGAWIDVCESDSTLQGTGYGNTEMAAIADLYDVIAGF